MTVEVIQAIGLYIVMPICIVIFFVVLIWKGMP